MATEEDKKREVAQRFAMLGLNPDNYETADQMLDDANGRVNNLNKNQAPGRMAMWKNGEGAMPENAPQGPQRAHRSPFNMQAYSGANPMQQDFIEQFGPHAQAKHLGGMISDVMGAYQDENDSRVAQAREQARMAHESDMAGMEYDALIQRLNMEADQREKDRILQKQLTSGITTRQFINGQWVDV